MSGKRQLLKTLVDGLAEMLATRRDLPFGWSLVQTNRLRKLGEAHLQVVIEFDVIADEKG